MRLLLILAVTASAAIGAILIASQPHPSTNHLIGWLVLFLGIIPFCVAFFTPVHNGKRFALLFFTTIVCVFFVGLPFLFM